MIITCPACATQFRVDGTKISPTGTKVRCAKCSHVWLQTPDKALPYPGAAAQRAAPPKPPAQAQPVPPPQRAPPPPAPSSRPAPAGAVPAESMAAAAPPRPAPAPPPPEPMRAAPPKPQPVPARTPIPSPLERPRPAAPPPRPPRPAAPFPAEEPAPARGLSFGTIISLALAVLVVGGLVYGLLHFRGPISDRVPVMGRFYEAIGLGPQLSQLALQNVTYGRTYEDGVPILEVRGEVVNTGAKGVDLPRIQAVLRDKDGAVLSRWTFVASKPRASPKETVGFVSRYPSPPPHAVSLALSFAKSGAN